MIASPLMDAAAGEVRFGAKEKAAPPLAPAMRPSILASREEGMKAREASG